MVTGFLVARSLTTSVEPAVSSDEIVPEMLRKLPETTSSASIPVPSAFFVPRARNWSPAWIASIGAGSAASNRTESGA